MMTMLAAMTALEPLLALYLAKHWLVFPCAWDGGKHPLVPRGFYAASRDPAVVAGWWRRWPRALVAIRTGKQPQGSGIAIVDVDLKYDGFATLARLIGPEPPRVPRVHTPSGGMHLYYQAPAEGCVSTVGIGGKRRRGLGPGLDVKADLSQCHAPGGSPSSPYRWDREFNLVTTPLPMLPAALTPVEIPEDDSVETATPRRQPIARPDAYARKAIEGALERVRGAVPGTQRHTLNAESYALGRLAAGMGLDRQGLVDDLVEAGMMMQQGGGRPAWARYEVKKTVLDGFRDGLAKPLVPQLRRRR
jgi:hypothetical protein